MRLLVTLSVVVLLALPLASCGKPSAELENLGVKLGEAWDAAKAYAVVKKDEALKVFGGFMDTTGQQLAEAKSRAAEMGADAAAALDAKWATAQTKFAELRDASGDQWAKARDAFTAAYEAFNAELAKHKAR
jgi:hypothetical protein